jgi:hypothetical protein
VPLVEPPTVSAESRPLVQPDQGAETVAAASAPGPAIAIAEPVPLEQGQPAPQAAPRPVAQEAPIQTVYVPAPVPPKRRGNRGFGLLIGILAAAIFALLYAATIAIIEAARGVALGLDFLTDAGYYVPVIFFLVGFAVLAFIINRGPWLAWVFGSILVGLFVYFGTIGVGLLSSGVIAGTPDAAVRLFGLALVNPFVIAAALLAREVTAWMGAAVSARGRRVKLRNAEDRATFEREAAYSRAELDDARRDPLL